MLFAGTDWGLVCLTVAQVLDVCLTGLVGDLWNWNAGLGRIGVGFIEPDNGMGDPCKTYGEM